MAQFNFLSVFSYVNLGQTAVSAVVAVQHALAASPVDGDELANDVMPVCRAIEQVLPKVRIPNDVVTECAQAVAAVLNQRKKPIPK